MKHSEETIALALRVIKEFCEQFDNCDDGCPLFLKEDDECGVKAELPIKWELNAKLVEKEWKAFITGEEK